MIGLTRVKLTSLVLAGSVLSAGVVLGHVLHCGVGVSCPTPSVPGGGGTQTRIAAAAAPVRVVGDVSRPMSPGATVPLDLELHNPNGMRLVATDLEVTLRTIVAPDSDEGRACSASDFRVDQAASDLRLTLSARATTSLSQSAVEPSRWPSVTMVDRPVEQDACKGARLRLDYTLSASRVQP